MKIRTSLTVPMLTTCLMILLLSISSQRHQLVDCFTLNTQFNNVRRRRVTIGSSSFAFTSPLKTIFTTTKLTTPRFSSTHLRSSTSAATDNGGSNATTVSIFGKTTSTTGPPMDDSFQNNGENSSGSDRASPGSSEFTLDHPSPPRRSELGSSTTVHSLKIPRITTYEDYTFPSSTTLELSSLLSNNDDSDDGYDGETKNEEQNIDYNQNYNTNLSKKYGMPWHTSIAPYTYPPTTTSQDTLLFMPYFEYMTSLLEEKNGYLTNVRPLTNEDEASYELYNYNESFPKRTKQPPASMSNHTPETKTPSSRVINQSYTSDEYRKIRMTYYDAGDTIQVFNSLWYPNPNVETPTNLPLMGIDLLAFGRKRYLVVIDFQPLPDYESCRRNIGGSQSSPIRGDKKEEKDDSDDGNDEFLRKLWGEGHQEGEACIKSLFLNIPSVLKGKMSKRFYDENQFFSKNMLFGRFDHSKEYLVYPPIGGKGESHSDVVHKGGGADGDTEEEGALFQAFQESLKAHINLVKSASFASTTKNNNDGEDVTKIAESEQMKQLILEGQRQYDVYSAKRDPAHALFTKNFGKDWADGYVYDYLFDLSGGVGFVNENDGEK